MVETNTIGSPGGLGSWDGVGRCLGVHCKLDGVGGPCLPGLLHTRLHGERAVERYTASAAPTTPLQSYTAYTALYSIIQHYTALYTIQLYSLYIIQHYTITLWYSGVRRLKPRSPNPTTNVILRSGRVILRVMMSRQPGLSTIRRNQRARHPVVWGPCWPILTIPMSQRVQIPHF